MKTTSAKADISQVERILFSVVTEVVPDRILGYKPKLYQVINTRTGVVKTYFACSPDRALALAYFDQGEKDEQKIID